MNLSDELMSFRTAYLQTIAHCWREPAEYEKIISKKGEKGKNLLESDLFQSYLPVKKDGNLCPLNWRLDVYLVENENKNLAKYVPYNPNSINGWMGGPDLMILKIPEAPPPEEQAKALMAYYESFNTLFGNSFKVSKTETSHAIRMITEKLLSLFTKHTTGYVNYLKVLRENSPTSLGNGSNDTFYSLGSVFMELIAVSWKNPNFFKYTCDTIISPIGTRDSLLRDEFITFRNPFSFNIKFQKVTDGNSVWDSSTGTWENLENNEVCLQFPKKPEPESDFTQALARYNGCGPTYPLTCA